MLWYECVCEYGCSKRMIIFLRHTDEVERQNLANA